MNRFFRAISIAGFMVLSMAVMEAKNPWKQMDRVLQHISEPTFPDRDFVITDFYNGSDTLFTQAIHAAIRACHAAGGGRVVIPDGVFKTGPIRLLSNVNLHLSEGTRLLFASNPALFPIVLTRYEGMDVYNFQPLVYAYKAKNIAITGKGVMDGQADETNWYSKDRFYGPLQADGKRLSGKDVLYGWKNDSVDISKRVLRGAMGIRPQFINFYRCENVLMEDFTLNRSPFWLIHPLMCQNVIVRRVTMQSHGINNDGCDPESCRNVLIEDCYFDTGDDCIAIKSGRDQDGRKWNIPSENIIVRRCRMKDGHAGVGIGSEITGGCRNVWVENCSMDSPHLNRIVRIKSNPERGGEVSNVYVRNVEVGQCDLAILGIELHYWNVYEGKWPPFFHDILLENITSKGCRYVLHVDGFEDKIQARNITLRNCRFNGVREPEVHLLKGVERVKMKNVVVNK